MGRLTTREYGAYCVHANTLDCDDCNTCKWNLAIINKLAHYEDLEEQGRLIEVIRCDDCCHQQYCKQAQYLGTDGYCSKAELKELEGEKCR